MADETFETGGAGAALEFPQQASACRKGSHLMIKGRACKITEMSTSKTGKHGHAKCKFVAVDIFDGTKHEMIETSTHNVSVPNVERNEFQLLDIEGDTLSLMNGNGDTKDDLDVPQGEVGTKIREAWATAEAQNKDVFVTVLSAIGKELAIEVKMSNN